MHHDQNQSIDCEQGTYIYIVRICVQLASVLVYIVVSCTGYMPHALYFQSVLELFFNLPFSRFVSSPFSKTEIPHTLHVQYVHVHLYTCIYVGATHAQSTCTWLVALPCIPGFKLSQLSCPGSSVGRALA